MSKVLESLLEHKESVQQELTEAQEGLEAAKSAFDAAESAYEAANNRAGALRYQLKEVSVAIEAIEKSARVAEGGVSVTTGNLYAPPFRRQRRNIRAMVMDVLRSASDPMDVKQIMRATDSTKITVNKALTRLMMLGQVTPVENGWIVKKDVFEGREEDDEEEEKEHEGEDELAIDYEREHMYE